MYIQNIGGYMNKTWSEEEEKYVQEHYKYGDIKVIAQQLGRTVYSVIDRATKTLGLQKDKNEMRKKVSRGNRKYQVDETYFKSIDCHEKAYWYGFLWADGSITKTRLEFTLKEEDRYAIEAFRHSIKSNHPIIFREQHGTYRLMINSMELTDDLKALNIVENKSYGTCCPKISDLHFVSFFLGLHDGDGSLTNTTLRITNTYETCIWLQHKLKTLLGINAKVYRLKQSHASILCINKKADKKVVLSAAYQKCPFYLKRKHQSFGRMMINC
jgi:hypothetical protein